MTRQILIVAGEASSDRHAAHLVKELRASAPETVFFGVGGERLIQEGFEAIIPSESVNVVGGSDWLDKVAGVLRAFRVLKKEIDGRRPDLAILLDLPDFNLKLAGFLKSRGIPVSYYISPQVWAWRRYRLRKIRRTVDRLLVVFPFEKDFFDRAGIPAEFVGHPLLEQVITRLGHRPQNDVVAAPRVALLPGSRSSEVRYHAEILNALSQRLRQRYPTIQIRIPVASTLDLKTVESFFPTGVELTKEDSHAVLRWADVAAVASGTATLETAIIGTPFCLFYRMSASTAWIIRHLIRYKGFYGMPNLLQGTEVVREFLHERATVENLFEEMHRLIDNDVYRSQVAQDLTRCRSLLGNIGASRRAAERILSLLPA